MELKKQDKPTLVALITASDFRNRHIAQHYGKLTMQEAMNANSPTVWRWAKNEGEDKIINGIAKLFIGVSLYFGDAIPQDAAESIVVDILADYELSNLKLEDLVVIGKELKEKDINRSKLTPNKIINHIKDYWKRRVEEATRTSLNASLTQKNNDTMDINQRIKGTIALPDAQGKRVDRTRTDVQQYYKSE